jgi:cation-transporting ATPase 13A2
VKDASNLLNERQGKDDAYSAAAILYTMTTCHSLKLVQDEIIGDPLDAKMFEFTGWTFEEGGRIYEYVQDPVDGKEDDEAGLLGKDDAPVKGKYVTRDGNERAGLPAVRPPVAEGVVIWFVFVRD